MKILIDARLYGLENAGLGRYLINLIDELARIEDRNEYTLLLRKKYFDTLNLPNNWKKLLADFRHYSLIEQIRLPGLINKQNPDIVHFPHFNIPVFYKDAFVVTIHDILMHKQKGKRATTLSPIRYHFKRLGYRMVFDRAIRKATKVIVPSNYVKKELLNYYEIEEEKLVVVYEGLDERVSPRGKGKGLLRRYNLNTDYFIYTGNAYPHKNLERVIEAVALLNKRRNKKILFAIASARNVFTEKLKKLIIELNAEKYVRLLGFVPDKDLGHLYENSLAFIYASLSEGFGLPGLESIAAGTLVLASDIPVFREIYKNNVIYFNPLDFSAIEKSMENVLDMRKEKREKIIQKGQKFIERYSWSKMAKQILKVYESSSSLRQD